MLKLYHEACLLVNAPRQFYCKRNIKAICVSTVFYLVSSATQIKSRGFKLHSCVRAPALCLCCKFCSDIPTKNVVFVLKYP